MIFITIGTQEPFERLVEAMEEVAASFPEKEFVAQVHETSHRVKHLKTISFLEPVKFNELFNRAELIVSHAGMGTIISALTQDKPIIVIPRQAKLGEHRNEHQLATARKMKELNYVRVVFDTEELKKEITALLKSSEVKPLHTLGSYASNELLNSLSGLVDKVK